MKRLVFSLVIGIAAFIAFRPGVVYAQGPTDLCINGTISDTTYLFTGGSMPTGFSVPTQSEWGGFVADAGFDELDCGGSGTVMGTFTPGSGIQSVWCPAESRQAVGWWTNGIYISSPISGTLTAVQWNGPITSIRPIYCLKPDGEWLRLGDGPSLTIPQGTQCLNIFGGATWSSGFEYATDFSVSCGVGEYAPATTCDLVPNADFTTTDDWLLAGTATITNSTLTLSPADSAAQNLSGLSSDTTYDVTIQVSDITTGTASLDVSLGTDSITLLNIIAGTNQTTLTTPQVVAGPLEFRLQNTGSANLSIDFACLSLATTGPGGNEQNECIAPPNGEFSSTHNWSFLRGATLQQSTKNGKLPHQTQGLIKTSQTFTIPTTLAAGEYLLLGFDAHSNDGDSVIVSRTAGITAEVIGSLETYQSPYRYELDISSLPSVGDTQAGLSFVNAGDDGYNGFFGLNDIFIDNVCIFVSDDPPELPTATDPSTYTPVDLSGSFYNCSDIDQLIWTAFGVDLRYHRINYEDTPGFLDFSDWVPWLVSWGWVVFQTYTCLLLTLFETLANLLEYLLNNALNIFAWLRANYQNFIPWLAAWLQTLSWQNILEFIRGTAENWLTWAALTVIEFATVPNSLVLNLATLALWLSGGFIWLGALLFAALLWLATEGDNVARRLLNVLLEDGWNAFLVALGDLFGELINVGLGIWNDSLVPFLELILSYLVAGPLAVLDLFAVTWAFIWAVIQYFWVNVFQGLNIPFSFYTGLSEGIQSTAFSDLISCDGSTTNFWCNMFASLDLVNGVAGHTIFYPIVIVGIVLATIAILYRNVVVLWNTFADWLTRI